METILVSGSPVSSQALLSGLINTDKINRGNIRSNIFMSYATAASYRGLRNQGQRNCGSIGERGCS
jgi:hypothetical protein